MNEPLGIAIELAERRKRIAALQSPAVRARIMPVHVANLADDVKRLTAENVRLAEENARLLDEVERLGEVLQVYQNSGQCATSSMDRRKTTARVCGIFEKHFGISPGGIIDPTKERPYVRARYAAVMFFLERMGWNKVTVGRMIRRDHHTIGTALRSAHKLRDTDAAWLVRYDEAAAEALAPYMAKAA